MNFITIFILVLNFNFLLCKNIEPNVFENNEDLDVVANTNDGLTKTNNNFENQETINGEDKKSNDYMQADEAVTDSIKGEVTAGSEVRSTYSRSTIYVSTEEYGTVTNITFPSHPPAIEENTIGALIIETTTPDPDFVDLFDDNIASTEASTTESTATTSTEVTTVTQTLEETTKINDEFIEEKKAVYINKLSDQIRNVLEKYKESGNVVISDVPIPDPLHIPDMEKRFSMANMVFRNQTVYGLGNFTVQHINTDLDKMQVFIILNMKRLVILGNYTMRSIFNRAAGPFNVTLLDVTTEGAAALHYTPDGKLEASETDMDMSFNDIKLDFKNLGFMGSFFQGVIGAVGSFVFEGIKPAILTEVNTNVRSDINAKIRTMSNGIKTNKSISPVDQAVIEGRRYVREQGYDPYLLANHTRSVGLFQINVTEFSLKGLSRFYKVGGISLSMDNGTVEFGIHLATDKLSGRCQWSVGVSKTPIRKGISVFTVEHLQIRAIIRQSLDLTEHPKLHDLDFLLGNITLKTRREDTIDYIVELVVNNLPSLFRHIIVDGLEDPVKNRAQLLLNEVNMEALVDEHLPDLDNFGV